jgi:hypothetical protein
VDIACDLRGGPPGSLLAGLTLSRNCQEPRNGDGTDKGQCRDIGVTGPGQRWDGFEAQGLLQTIANGALPFMQGSFSASFDEITWVLTSYIIASAIMTAPVGWLAARYGR